MVIQVDSRQQKGKHELKHKFFEEHGFKLVTSKLLVGDYCIPSNGSVAVDTKKDILELYTDLVSQHDRFVRECMLAQEAEIKLYVLVENKDGVTSVEDLGSDKWVNPLWFKWYRSSKKMRPPIKNVSLMKMAHTIEEKYGVKFVFCAPEDAGAKVLDLLGVEYEKNE